MNHKLFITATFLLCSFFLAPIYADVTPRKIGISIGIQQLNGKKAKQLKDAGIDCIETSLTAFIVKDSLSFKLPDEEIITKLKAIKKATDNANLEVWSIHMPYGENVDISVANEEKRAQIISFHKKVLHFVSILQPKIILFHPSWYLNLNERAGRTAQLIKSVKEINKAVKAINATMVVENMLGPHLLTSPNSKRESPLLRTIDEALTIFKAFPKDVYSAVDLNHISNPELFLLAMGSRVQTIHVADGDGKAERHYFPCDGKGENNWKAIMQALDKIDYKGPFMYESTTTDIKQYKACYDNLVAQQ